MTTPKLYKGDTILIDGNAYMVIVGLKKHAIVSDDHVYNVHLKSVRYDPNKFPPDIYEKNVNLPPFELI